MHGPNSGHSVAAHSPAGMSPAELIEMQGSTIRSTPSFHAHPPPVHINNNPPSAQSDRQERNISSSSNNNNNNIENTKGWQKMMKKKRQSWSGVRDENQVAEEVLKSSAILSGSEEKEQPRDGDRTLSVPYYRLFSHADMLDYALMLVGSLAAVAHGISLPVFLVYLGKLIDSLGTMTADMANQVIKYALYFVYLSVLRFGAGWLEVSMWMYTGDRQSSRIRRRYVRALISQEVGFFDTDISTGEVVAGISGDTILLQEAVGTKVGNLIHSLAQFVAGFIIAFSILWKLTLLTLSVMPIIVLSGGVFAYVMVNLSSRSKQEYMRAGDVAQEVISQIRTVHAFGAEEKASKSYLKALKSSVPIGKRSGIVKGMGIGSLYGLGFAAFSLLLWYAGKLVRSGDANGGVAFTTILNVIASSLSLGQAAPHLATISKAKVSGYTILRVIDRKPIIADNKDDGIRLEKIQGNIEFRDVTFSYPSRPDIDVFRNFSLSIAAGKVVAIVGSSGSGKSTTISLIERFYDPTSGEVLVDGYNIKKMHLKWLREQMGLVNQEPALFATSIRENIMYGKAGDVCMDDIINATTVSYAHDFINLLPDRYETQVGERGLQLSGGQKQRIAIARAILKNPSILLLDEATSALDSESEKGVQEALDRVMLGRTTVVVAHRLSTIQNAHMIAVIADGKVVEMGSNEELLAKGGAYATLMKVQQTDHYRLNSGVQISRFDNRYSHRSVSGSVSQRTFSFRSSADVTIPNASVIELGADDFVGPRPSWKRLIKMYASEWPYGLLGAFGAIVAGAQTPIFALLITQALEYFYSPNYDYMKKGLEKVAALCCASGVVVLSAYACEYYFTESVGEGITLRVRSMMFTAILRNEVSWFDENSSAVLTARLSADAPLVRTVLVDRVITLVQNMGLMITAFVITIKLQWKIALVVISTFPAMIVSYAGQIQLIKGFSGDLEKAHMKANMIAGEAVSNIRTVAAFSAEDRVMKLFERELQKFQKRSFIRAQIAGIGFGLSQFCLMCAYSLAFWYSSGLMKRGEADFGSVMKCFMVLIITAFGVAEALSLAPAFFRGTDTLRGVFGNIDRQTEIDTDDPNAEEAKHIEGEVELKRVTFAYPTRHKVQIFKDLSLRVRTGQSLALVGSSGSGKSSVIALIARFYDPQGGHVVIDGRDIRQYRLSSLRRHMAIVQQEPALFSTSIYENIAYGKEGAVDATEAEIVEAAKVANAHTFICGLPEGYKTEVGERGVQLSGGQKQRVAIARAVLRNPAILLLDEATSALDTESEKVVQEALERLMERRTTVVVAHRLSTVRNVHTIAVLQEGSIAEEGSHKELVATQGAYFHLLNLSTSHS